jgi:hypothetical protein
VIDSPAPAQGARFGEALARAGQLLLVGAPREAGRAPDTGAVHVLTACRACGWIGSARLTASAGASGDRFGAALDGSDGSGGSDATGGRRTWAAIGAPGAGAGRGAVHLFGQAGGPWLELGVLRAAAGAAGDGFGAAVALDGAELLVGAPGADAGAGAAMLYERDPFTGAWLERARWSAPAAPGAAPGAAFGTSLDLEDGWALVGAPGYAAPDAPLAPTGAVFAFERTARGWAMRGALAPGYARAQDALGSSVCLDRRRALVGAPGRDAADDTGQSWVDSGAALLLARLDGAWTVERELLPSAPRSDELYGASVALRGATALVGAPDSAEGGAVYVLGADPSGEAWIQSARLVASDGGQRYGHALVLGTGTGVAGAPAKDLPGLSSAGGAYALAGLDQLPPVSYCAPGTSPAGCRARLSSQGWPSSSAPSGFTVQARGADAGAPGAFLYGTHGRAALPFGPASTLCIAPPLARTPELVASGPAGTCQGALELDLNAFWSSVPGAALPAGTAVHVQLWYRARGAPGALSDALELSLCP